MMLPCVGIGLHQLTIEYFGQLAPNNFRLTITDSQVKRLRTLYCVFGNAASSLIHRCNLMLSVTVPGLLKTSSMLLQGHDASSAFVYDPAGPCNADCSSCNTVLNICVTCEDGDPPAAGVCPSPAIPPPVVDALSVRTAALFRPFLLPLRAQETARD